MKYQLATALLCLTAVNALPASSELSIQERQASGQTSNELKSGPCRAVTFIMARGSTEPGNMGMIPGPPTCAGLKQMMGADNVACQGIGTEDGYSATLQANFQTKNTSPEAIKAATTMINMAVTKCPDSQLILGGYSQGTAVMDNAIQSLPASTQSKIQGVVFFGYTRNAQDKGAVPGFPSDKLKVICAQGDLVCDNTLTITAAHLSYAANAPEAATFLASKVSVKGAATAGTTTGTDTTGTGTGTTGTGTGTNTGGTTKGGKGNKNKQ